MKKSLIKGLNALIASLLIVGLLTSCDDDNNSNPNPLPENPDVIDIALSQDRFSILTTAIGQANLTSTLRGNGPFTIFAPTDQAFEAYLTANGLSAQDLLASPDLAAILTYHVIGAQVLSTGLSDGFVETVNGGFVKVDLSSGVGIDNASVVEADITATNGVIHVIDEVLLPPLADIVDLAVTTSTSATPEFTQLVAALTKVQNDPNQPNLIDVLKGTDVDFTVFAPTDAAFEALYSFLGVNGIDDLPASLLTDVLLYHVVGGNRVFSTVLTSGSVNTQLPNQSLQIDAQNLQINDAGTLLQAGIVTSILDVQGTNGVIHGIDKVLLPARNIMDLVNFNAEFSILKAAIETAGLGDALSADSAEGLTVFAPTNDAFTAYLAAANLSAEELLGSPLLSKILLYHVVGGTVASTDLQEVFVPTLNDMAVQVSLQNGVSIIDIDAQSPDATVAIADLSAGNGIVHAIDQVLIPELQNTVVDIALGNDQFSTLVSLLSENPEILAALSNGEGNFTVFAPTNAAFEAIADVLDTLTPEQVASVLQYHVIDGRVFSTDLSDGLSASTLLEQEVTFAIGGAVTIQDADANSADASVISVNIQGINGVVHVIDQVLIPAL